MDGGDTPGGQAWECTKRWTTMAAIDNAGTEVLSPEEERRMIDDLARKYHGMSGEAFVRGWNDGAFDDDPDRPEVIRIVMFLPKR